MVLVISQVNFLHSLFYNSKEAKIAEAEAGNFKNKKYQNKDDLCIF